MYMYLYMYIVCIQYIYRYVLMHIYIHIPIILSRNQISSFVIIYIISIYILQTSTRKKEFIKQDSKHYHGIDPATKITTCFPNRQQAARHNDTMTQLET